VRISVDNNLVKRGRFWIHFSKISSKNTDKWQSQWNLVTFRKRFIRKSHKFYFLSPGFESGLVLQVEERSVIRLRLGYDLRTLQFVNQKNNNLCIFTCPWSILMHTDPNWFIKSTRERPFQKCYSWFSSLLRTFFVGAADVSCMRRLDDVSCMRRL
jgi:hypothetical protein